MKLDIMNVIVASPVVLEVTDSHTWKSHRMAANQGRAVHPITCLFPNLIDQTYLFLAPLSISRQMSIIVYMSGLVVKAMGRTAEKFRPQLLTCLGLTTIGRHYLTRVATFAELVIQ